MLFRKGMGKYHVRLNQLDYIWLTCTVLWYQWAIRLLYREKPKSAKRLIQMALTNFRYVLAEQSLHIDNFYRLPVRQRIRLLAKYNCFTAEDFYFRSKYKLTQLVESLSLLDTLNDISRSQEEQGVLVAMEG